jgi:Secretion system effector C (SseC) like family
VNTVEVAAPVAPPVPSPAPLPVGEEPTGLPEPVLTSVGANDLLGMMMALMDSMARQSMEASANKLQMTQKQLNEAVAELSEKLQEAARKAAEAAAKDDDGGLFGGICDAFDAVGDFLGKVVGEVAGTAADFTVDLVMAPCDLIAGMIQGQGFTEALRQVGDNLKTNDGVAATVKGFTTGVTKFLNDVAQFSVSYLAVIEAGVSGENVWEAMKSQLSDLGHSFMNNLVRNPDVMAVTSWVLKGIAVAAAVGSGGILGGVAVGLFVLSELNQRYGAAEKLFGAKAGGAVSLGIELVSTAMLIGASGGLDKLAKYGVTDALDVVKGAGAVVQGAVLVGAAINDYTNAQQAADALDQQADMQEVMNRISRLQRLMESLIDELGEKTERHQQSLKGASQLFHTQGATLEASLFRA